MDLKANIKKTTKRFSAVLMPTQCHTL